MKKAKIATIATAVLLLLATFVSAQNNNGQTLTTIEGTLKLKNGDVAIESKGETYFAPRLLRYSNFIDGIKEGAKVKVQGYEGRYNMFMPTSITVNGKTHDISGNFGRGGGYGRHGGYGYGRGGGRGYGGGFGPENCPMMRD